MVNSLALHVMEQHQQRQEEKLHHDQVEEQEEADECPICLDALDTTATLVCGHIFHRACIDDWATTQATCPCCRVPLEITN